MDNTVNTADLIIVINQLVSDANKKKAEASRMAAEADGMLAAAEVMRNEFTSQIDSYKNRSKK